MGPEQMLEKPDGQSALMAGGGLRLMIRRHICAARNLSWAHLSGLMQAWAIWPEAALTCRIFSIIKPCLTPILN